MSNVIESSDSLRDWKNYRKVLKLQVDGFPASGPVFVTKEKFEFDVNGRPWRSQAVLLGEKGKRSAQLLKKEGVVFKEGTAQRTADGLVVSGVGGKSARGAIATFGKLALGVEVTSADPLDEDAEDRSDEQPGAAATATPPPPGGAAPGAARAEPPPAKHEHALQLVLSIDTYHGMAISGSGGTPAMPSGNPKVDDLTKLMFAIINDPRLAGKRAPAWKKAAIKARSIFNAVGKRATTDVKEMLFEEQFPEAERQLDAIFKVLERSDALVKMDSTIAEGKRTIEAGERERSEEVARERREKLRDEMGGDVKVEQTYDLLRVDPDVFEFLAQVDALTAKSIGHAPVTVDEKLRWIENVDRVRNGVKSAVAKVVGDVRKHTRNLRADWEAYYREWGQSGVARISEFFGGAYNLQASDFDFVDGLCTSAVQLAQRGKVRAAADEAQRALSHYDRIAVHWAEFNQKSERAAGIIATGLTVVDAISWQVLTLYFTGPFVAARVTGTAAKVVATAAAGAGVAAARSARNYVGHVLAGTTEKFDVTAEMVDVFKSGAVPFAGLGVEAYAKAKLVGKLVQPFTQFASARYGTSVGGYAGRALEYVITTSGPKLVERIVEGSIDAAAGKSFGSTGDFLEFLVEKSLRGSAANLFEDMLKGDRPKDQQEVIEMIKAAIAG